MKEKMWCLLKKVDNKTLNQINNKVNDIFNKVPNCPKKLFLQDDYWTKWGPRLFHCSEGFYMILLLDHAQASVYFLGKSVSDVIKNLVKFQVNMSISYYSINERNNIYQYVEEDLYNAPLFYDILSGIRIISVDSLLRNQEGVADINAFHNIPLGIELCYDESMGYLFITYLTKERLGIYKLGLTTQQAIYSLSSMIKVVPNLKIHNWDW